MSFGARLVALAAVLAATAVSGCGQQGPLVLPGDARPIERVEPPPATESEDGPADDEGRDER